MQVLSFFNVYKYVFLTLLILAFTVKCGKLLIIKITHNIDFDICGIIPSMCVHFFLAFIYTVGAAQVLRIIAIK